MQRKREFTILAVFLAAGIAAAILVYVGDAFDWPRFNRKDGFIGVGFMDAILYAINDPWAIHIVAFLWFVYAGLIPYVAFCFVRQIIGRR